MKTRQRDSFQEIQVDERHQDRFEQTRYGFLQKFKTKESDLP